MPDTESRTATRHPMDPRRGENLSPMFQAFLCWLLELPPMTEPAITGVALAGDSVLAATDADPLFNAHLGSLADFARNIRGWGEACGADAATVEGLVTKLRGAGRT
ncbi:MAG: hypothetical protein F4X91_03925 [Nitrospinae bacterium]|nr:hypothetical protein [Nitrospinota bacterium]